MSTVLWWLARPWSFTLGPLDARPVAVALLLMAAGFLLGMAAERRDVVWAAAWGRWFLARLERWLASGRVGWGRLALGIAVVNIASVGLIAASSPLVPLPPLLMVLTGLNTGVMAQRTAGGKAWMALLMPHAWIELPAVILCSAAALEAAATVAGIGWFDVLADPVWALAFWIHIGVPLLVGAAIIEAAFMVAWEGLGRGPETGG